MSNEEAENGESIQEKVKDQSIRVATSETLRAIGSKIWEYREEIFEILTGLLLLGLLWSRLRRHD